MGGLGPDLPDEDVGEQIEDNIDATNDAIGKRTARRGRPKKVAAAAGGPRRQQRSKRKVDPTSDDDYEEELVPEKQAKVVLQEGS